MILSTRSHEILVFINLRDFKKVLDPMKTSMVETKYNDLNCGIWEYLSKILPLKIKDMGDFLII